MKEIIIKNIIERELVPVIYNGTKLVSPYLSQEDFINEVKSCGFIENENTIRYMRYDLNPNLNGFNIVEIIKLKKLKKREEVQNYLNLLQPDLNIVLDYLRKKKTDKLYMLENNIYKLLSDKFNIELENQNINQISDNKQVDINKYIESNKPIIKKQEIKVDNYSYVNYLDWVRLIWKNEDINKIIEYRKNNKIIPPPKVDRIIEQHPYAFDYAVLLNKEELCEYLISEYPDEYSNYVFKWVKSVLTDGKRSDRIINLVNQLKN